MRAQRAQRLGAVDGRTPDAAPGDAHGAEAETADRDLAANPEGAGRGGVGGLCRLHCFAWHGEILCVAECSSAFSAGLSESECRGLHRRCQGVHQLRPVALATLVYCFSKYIA